MEPSRPTFGLCIIVKDGAHLLYRILDKVASHTVFDQVVVLDTGSTDGTVEMLRTKYPWVETHQTEWKFDFSIARNEALSYIKTDVWMWLDADDTFTDDTLERWAKVAQSLWDGREEKGRPVYALIPYIYEVDKNDIPVVVHYRERIMLGTEGWQWREPLHEVCYYNLPGGDYVAFNDCPVVHRPVGEDVAQVNGDRNWKILMRHYVDGDRSDRTLYYIARMANMRGQYEFVLQVAPKLLEREPGGYYEYEAAVAVGEAYVGLYKRDAVPEYKDRAIEALTRAKRFEPTRNDARQKLCDLYIHCRDAESAISEANALNEGMPATVATTLPAYYGKYKYSVLAMVYFRLVGNIWHAMCNHMKALDCPKPHPTSLQLDSAVRAYLEDHDVGVIYADEKYVNPAMALRKALLTQGKFREVLVFNDPHCVAFARGVYFHFTEKEATLYQEDGHPRLRKFLVSPHLNESSVVPFGYEAVCAMPQGYHDIDELVEGVYDPVRLVYASSLQQGIEHAMACRSEKVCVSFTNDSASVALLELEQESPVQSNKVRFVLNNIGDLVGITGWVRDVSTFFVDDKNVLRTMSMDDIEMTFAKSVPGMAEDVPGLRFKVDQVAAPKKTVVVAAPGIEDWDGTTPRRWGIGASESCVVYLAEQLAKRGYAVTVYNTCARSQVVAGVAYVPMVQYHDTGVLCDLYVSSRIPEALNMRRGKRQVLWMHDIAEAYAHRLNNQQVIDRFVAVSDWQRERALQCNFKASKCVVIPNGIVNWPATGVERKKGRSVWLSQPERGIDNLHAMWKRRPELFSDLWVVYGFYNLMNYGRGDTARMEEAFYDSCRYKHALRQMKAKILGRLPHKDVQRLSQSAERWVYPSVFPETFCVAGLEALHNGVQCFFTSNGATAETILRASYDTDGVPRAVMVGESEPFDAERDSERWLNAIEVHAGINTKTGLNDPFYYWERVANDWEALINGT